MSKKTIIDEFKLSDIKKESKANKKQAKKNNQGLFSRKWSEFKLAVNRNMENLKTILENIYEFIKAVGLMTISLFAMYMAYYRFNFDSNLDYGLFASGALFAIEAFMLLVKHYSRKAS